VKDTDKAGAGLFIAGVLLLLFFVPIMVIVGGTLGVMWQSPWFALFVVGVFTTAWLVRREQKDRRAETQRTSAHPDRADLT
jgi:membrane protein implicated in regulation of membrane protease activity